MAVAEANGHLRHFDAASRVRITGLAPDAEFHPNAFIKAQVALVWPYSSSKRQVAFLLTDVNDLPSFSKGQIKVVFLNGIARKVAESKIGIGDTVYLSLEGASFVGVQDVITTPGKRVDFDIHFGRRLRLEATTVSNSPINIDATSATPPLSPSLNGHALATPLVPAVTSITTADSIAFTPSRAYKAIARTGSGAFRSSPLNTLVSEDDNARSRKRTKYGRFSGAWRMVSSDDDADDKDEAVAVLRMQESQRSPSSASPQIRQPVSKHVKSDSAEVFILPDTLPSTSQTLPDTFVAPTAGSVPSSEVDTHSTNIMGPVVGTTATEGESPSEIAPSTMVLRDAQDGLLGRSEAVPTPRLTPIFSPGLPLISPLAQPNAYFEPLGHVSELDASSLRIGDHFSIPTVDEADFAQYNQPGLAIMSLPNDQSLESATNIHVEGPPDPDVIESPQLHAYPAPMVDLDFLQEQIDLASAEVADAPAQHLVREDEDMYGPPLQSQATGTPDVPVEISSDEGEEEESEEDSQNEAIVGDHDADVAKVSESGATHQLLPSTEEPLRPDPYDVTSVLETGCIQTAVDDADQATPSQVATLMDQLNNQDAIEAAMEVEGHFSAVPLDSHPPVISTSPVPSQFLDGVSEKAPQKSEFDMIESTGMIDNNSMREEAVLIAAEPTLPEITSAQGDSPKTTFAEKASAIQGQLFTLDATQATPMKPFLGVQSVQALPATPDNSQPPKAQLPESSVRHQEPESEIMPTHSAQPPELRSSQRLLSKPRNPEGLFSDYFSPPAKSTPVSQHPKSARKVLAASQDVEPSSPSVPLHMRPIEGSKRFRPEHESSPVREFKGRTTDLSYYPSLHSLVNHFNQLVDIIGIVTADSAPMERAKSGPKDYHTTLYVTDASLLNDNNSNNAVQAQLFRPRKTALPVVQKDDIVILRDFTVQTMAHQPILLSTDSSAWATLRASSPHIQLNSGPLEIVSPGPPIELSTTDTEQAVELLHWWHSEGCEKYLSLLSQDRADIQSTGQNVDEELSHRDIPSSPPVPVTEALPSSPSRATDFADSSPVPNRITSRGYTEEEHPEQHRPPSLSSKPFEEAKPDKNMPTPLGQNEPNDKAGSASTNDQQVSVVTKRQSRRKPPPANVRTSIEIELPPPPPRRLTRSQSALSPTQPHHSSLAGSPTSPVSVITNASARSQLSPESAETRSSARFTRRGSQHSAAPAKSPRTARRSHRRSATSESIVHELRDGTTYIDEVSAPQEEDNVGVLEATEPSTKPKRASSAVPTTPGPRRGLRSQTNVHELRDGTKYTDKVEDEGETLDMAGDQAQQNNTSRNTVTAKPALTEAHSDSQDSPNEPEDDTIYINQDNSITTTTKKAQKVHDPSKDSGEATGRSVPTRRGLRNQKPVHELRDGVKYVD